MSSYGNVVFSDTLVSDSEWSVTVLASYGHVDFSETLFTDSEWSVTDL